LAGIFPADTGGGGVCPAEGGTEGADAPLHIVALCVDVPECVKKDSVVVEDTPCGFEKVGVDGADGTSVGFGAEGLVGGGVVVEGAPFVSYVGEDAGMFPGHAAAGAQTRIAVCLRWTFGFVAETSRLVKGAVGMFAEGKIGTGSQLSVAELTTEAFGFDTGAGVRVGNESLPLGALGAGGTFSLPTIGFVEGADLFAETRFLVGESPLGVGAEGDFWAAVIGFGVAEITGLTPGVAAGTGPQGLGGAEGR